MSALSSATRPFGPTASRLGRRHAWTAAVVVFFAVLLAWSASQTRNFGAFELQTLLASTLPLAYLAMAQSVVVIGGGIDLSVGAMLVLVNCLSARLMEGTDLGGSALASDAFFPFSDGPQLAIDAGATCVIQPGGSKRDPEVVEAADAAGISMVFTHRRHFKH